MSKAHTISDSDSDSDVPVPLSERLLSGFGSKKEQSHTSLLAKKLPGRQSQVADTESHEASSAVTLLHSVRTFSGRADSTDKLTSIKPLKRHGQSDAEKDRSNDELYQRKQEQLLQKEQHKNKLLEKQKIKEYENAKKRTIREAQKTARPGEAIKSITVILDPTILKSPAGTIILDTLQKHDICYEIQSQVLPGIITFWREITEVVEKEPLRLETEKKEVVEDEILLVVPLDKFVSLVYNYKQNQACPNSGGMTLKEHILEVKECLEHRNVTLIIQDMTKYLREQEAHRQKNTCKNRKRRLVPNTDLSVSRLDVEEALIDVQLQTRCNVRFVSSDLDMAKTVLQYTKAIADAPFKRERLKNGLSLYVSGTGTVKISRDGHGVQQAWRQQLMQFRNVKADAANAIMSQYKSPLQLWKAYQNCSSEEEAELLLQDIVIRRGVGVMATTRRIGKELSRRLYLLFTSTDPNIMLT